MPKQDTFTTAALAPALAPALALVSRASGTAAYGDQYLVLSPSGRHEWTKDPAQATAFASMREAARMAVSLPSALRAFGLLRDIEVDAHRTLH